MNPVKKRKPTSEEMEKAINPELTGAIARLCGRTFKVLVLPLNKEQVFLKLLRRVMPSQPSQAAIVDALLSADLSTLCELASFAAANSGQDIPQEEILRDGRLADLVDVITVQMNENGYLDFLVKTMVLVQAAVLSARS